MAVRITEKDLEAQVKTINELTGNPTEPFDENGEYNVGTYIIDRAYGGVSFHKVVSKHGALKDISNLGFTTKKELFVYLRGFIDGLPKIVY